MSEAATMESGRIRAESDLVQDAIARVRRLVSWKPPEPGWWEVGGAEAHSDFKVLLARLDAMEEELQAATMAIQWATEELRLRGGS